MWWAELNNRLTLYSLLASFENWITSYRSEHIRVGLQQGLSFAVALLPVLINALYEGLDRGGSVLYTAITVAVVLEPSTGDSFRKLVLRLVAAGVSGGVGLLMLFIVAGHEPYRYDELANAVAGWLVPAMSVLGFVFRTNRQRYWQHRQFWDTALLTLPIVMVPAIRETNPDIFYSGAAYRIVNIVSGIVIAAGISFFIFPVRARGLLKKQMASSLLQIGDLTVWLVGQACTPPQAGTAGNIPGTSCTDRKSLYRDDGLHAKLAPLMSTAQQLGADLAQMEKLLEAARAEVYLVSKPRRFPADQYRDLLNSCHVVLGIITSLLYSLESGEISLQCCHRNIGDLSEAGVRLSAAFTALSTLIRPPKKKKAKKKKKKGGKKGISGGSREAQGAGGKGAGVCTTGSSAPLQGQLDAAGAQSIAQALDALPGSGMAAAALPTAAANGTGGSGSGSGAPGMGMRMGVGQRGSSLAAPLVDLESAEQSAADDDDDPFAALQTGEAGPGQPSAAPVVNLSDSQLQSVQQLARRMSRLMSQRSQRGSGGSAALVGLSEELQSDSDDDTDDDDEEEEDGYAEDTQNGGRLAVEAAGAGAETAAAPKLAPGAGMPGMASVAGAASPFNQPLGLPPKAPGVGAAGAAAAPPQGPPAPPLAPEAAPLAARSSSRLSGAGAASLHTRAAAEGAAERRQWVLGKLHALVDSIKQLELAAMNERQRHFYQEGLPGFLLIVHACVNMTRQCGACYTALDPEFGAELHNYYQGARQYPALLAAIPRPGPNTG